MDLELRLGFKSSFNLMPGEEYNVSDDLLATLDQSGFEVGVHGLEHDGKLYSSKSRFARKAARINTYLKRWSRRYFALPLDAAPVSMAAQAQRGVRLLHV